MSEREEIRVLRGVVYMTNSRGPRTEPRGTPQEEVYKEDRITSYTKGTMTDKT